jgi:hypothetical protein
MKRASTFGLCLVAALALGAVLAASALAGKAESGPLKVYSTNLESHLGTTKFTIHSTSAIGHGEFTTPFSGTAIAIFSNVEVEGLGKKCSSGPPDNPGIVRTKLLDEETGYIKKPPTGTKTGVDFKPGDGSGLLAKFECEGLGVEVKESVIGETSHDESSKESKLNLEHGAFPFRNEPEKFEGGPVDILKSKFTGLENVELEALQEQKNVSVSDCKKVKEKTKKGVTTIKCSPAKTPAELNTALNSTQPEIGRCVKEKKPTGNYSDPTCHTAVAPGTGEYNWVPV